MYYGYRYYDSQSGRFLTVDMAPADSQNPQSINRYVYVLDNPNVHIDPTGLAGLPSGDPHYLTQKQEEELESEWDTETNYHISPRDAQTLVQSGIGIPQKIQVGTNLSGWAAAAVTDLAWVKSYTDYVKTYGGPTTTLMGLRPGVVGPQPELGQPGEYVGYQPTGPSSGYTGSSSTTGSGALSGLATSSPHTISRFGYNSPTPHPPTPG
jgi:uncharacterized protein RhaS with RHS repeats